MYKDFNNGPNAGIKGPWTSSEDQKLINGMHRLTNGTMDPKTIRWKQVAMLIPGRVGKQCRFKSVSLTLTITSIKHVLTFHSFI